MLLEEYSEHLFYGPLTKLSPFLVCEFQVSHHSCFQMGSTSASPSQQQKEFLANVIGSETMDIWPMGV